jgi:spoIIIJ-associated protein
MATEKGGEFRGKTVEAAISNGLAALGLSREAVEVEIVRAGSRGLLGIGAEDAVVRLTALPSGQQGVTRAPARPEPAPAPREEQRVKPEPAVQPRPEQRQAPRPRSSGQESRPAPQPEAVPVQPVTAPAPSTGDLRVSEGIEQGREYLAGLLERMNLRAEVQIVPQSEAESTAGERTLVLNVVGDDLGMLIGRQSEVLSSLQFITRLMVNQQTKSRSNLVVDVNGYKAKRAESLRKLALRTADQVMQTGRTMALEPMPPAERRIIHLALRNHPTVATQSVGEGSRRKVTIVPKKQ